jgi:UDP-4-amino-4,6-dideoxy-N-acetyl-beta-L-altrosamine transaminase
MSSFIGKKIIPYGSHEITQEDIDAVVKTLKSDFLTQGEKVGEFEKNFAKYIGVDYAIAVSNGTAALHLSALALDIKSGNKVITTPLSFVSTSNAVLFCGGQLDFCDIDPDTLILDINLVRKKLQNAPKGTYNGIIPVDFAGYPVMMEQFRNLADEFDLWILEDSCHAPGGYYKDLKNELQKCGNCKNADLAIFSFHPVKHIACGEGGMITTNNEYLQKKLINLRTHGIQKNAGFFNQSPGAWYYEMQNLGYNYRLSDINCSLGISQLNRADNNLQKRKIIAKKYDEAFREIDWIKSPNTCYGHAYHLYVIQVKRRKELFSYLRELNIYAQVHYIPIHLQPFYQKMGWKKGDFPIVENYYEYCLSIPIYPSLKDEEQDYVINKIISFE